MSMPDLKKAENGVYYIHWSEGRRSKRTSTKQRDERAAKIYMANWLLAEHAEPGRSASSVMVGDLWELYCKKHRVVVEDTRTYVWKNLKPHFAGLTVSQVTYESVGVYVKKRVDGVIGRPVTPATVRHELILLRACLNWCARPQQKILAKAEVPDFDLPPAGEPRDRWLRLEEVQRLLDAAAEARKGDRLSRTERFLWLALETAARKTAICQLTWDRVDFETNMIDYDVPGRKKTKKRRAQVPISKSLLPILKRAYEERAGDLVLDSRSEVWSLVKTAARNAKVDDVSPHVLRHTAATHMARRGVPLWVVAGVLKVTTALVEKVYAKHCPDGLAQGVEMISGGMLEQAE